MTINLSPLFHIEIVVHDAEASYQFLHKVFGAQKVEEHIPAYLEEILPGTKCIHASIGGVVLQIVQPTEQLPSWYKQLKEKGPGVHNLTFLVDDLDAAVEFLKSEGAPVTFSIELEKSRIFGSDAKGSLQVPMIDTMDKIGFRIELAETPVK